MKLRIFHLFVIYALCLCCQYFQGPKVPTELIGTWETSDAKYDTAQLQFTVESIIFNSGEDHQDKNQIVSVEKTTEHGTTLFTVDYISSEGAAYSVSLYYSISPDHEPVLQFKNQKNIIWNKM
jgi:hypothetical protein